MRVVYAQFGDVLDGHDAFPRRCLAQQRREQGGLAAAGGSRDEQVLAPVHGRAQPVGDGDGCLPHPEQTPGGERGEAQPLGARQPDGQQRARARRRRQHRMHPDAVGQPHIDAGAGLVDVAPAEGDQAHRQFPHSRFRAAPLRGVQQSVAGIHPQPGGAVDEQIGDLAVGGELGERAEHEHVEGPDRREHTGAEHTGAERTGRPGIRAAVGSADGRAGRHGPAIRRDGDERLGHAPTLDRRWERIRPLRRIEENPGRPPAGEDRDAPPRKTTG